MTAHAASNIQTPTAAHRRWQPLLEQWVLISPASSARPWSGALTNLEGSDQPAHDPDCYLCPGVTRANGTVNPVYTAPWAFDNDYPSLGGGSNLKPQDDTQRAPLAMRKAGGGCCRVLCWSAVHNATLADLPIEQMQQVVRLWQTEYTTLAARPDIANVLIFENKGIETGVSNLHPHGQIYATEFVTDTATRLRHAQQRHRQQHGQSLLQQMIDRPEYQQDLLLERGAHFVAIVPFAARFAYESWIVPRRHVNSIAELDATELDELAEMYQRQAQRYDRLFRRPSPNVTLLHNAPCDDHQANADWCFHIAMQPPLRDADKLKYLAGFESGSGNIVNPVAPEAAAAAIRACSKEPAAAGQATL